MLQHIQKDRPASIEITGVKFEKTTNSRGRLVSARLDETGVSKNYKKRIAAARVVAVVGSRNEQTKPRRDVAGWLTTGTCDLSFIN